jgi:hypothetical protein
MKTLNLRFSLILLGFVATTFSFLYYLSPERALKLDFEISRILVKADDNAKLCEQYALIAETSGWYPCYYPSVDSIYLFGGEVWKYGKTCLGKEGRYSAGYPVANLQYVRQFMGSEKDCLVQEKLKIYNYPALPECLKRRIKLLRPPGNKIDR